MKGIITHLEIGIVSGKAIRGNMIDANQTRDTLSLIHMFSTSTHLAVYEAIKTNTDSRPH